MQKQKIPRPIGNWTAEKLEHLSAYLAAFARATTRAQERYYIDAMAGCGECVMARTGAPTPGSAGRALTVTPPFTGIHLVELDRHSVEHLRRIMLPHPNVHVYEGDCNDVIPRMVLPSLSRIAPTLAFLDPTGVQTSWQLIQALANHRRGVQGRKVELLILFAFDMFINRWLSNRKLWPNLDTFYGNSVWQSEFATSVRLSEGIGARRERFINLYTQQLKDELHYAYVDLHGPLKHRNRILYHMIFATDHPDAQRIMSDVWTKERPIPGQLFYQPKFNLDPPSVN